MWSQALTFWTEFVLFWVQRMGGGERKMEKMGPVGGLIMSPYRPAEAGRLSVTTVVCDPIKRINFNAET